MNLIMSCGHYISYHFSIFVSYFCVCHRQSLSSPNSLPDQIYTDEPSYNTRMPLESDSNNNAEKIQYLEPPSKPKVYTLYIDLFARADPGEHRAMALQLAIFLIVNNIFKKLLTQKDNKCLP